MFVTHLFPPIILFTLSLFLAGLAGRNGLYASYGTRSGLTLAPNSGSGIGIMGNMAMVAGGSSHFGVGHPHSLLTQGNLANNNNNGNHSSTSISESQSQVTKGVTVGGKRRHNSVSDGGHQSASANVPVALANGILLQDGESHLSSLVQLPVSSSSVPTTSALTYTGLDGKIGIDIIENVDGRGGSGPGLSASSLNGLGLNLHSHATVPTSWDGNGLLTRSTQNPHTLSYVMYGMNSSAQQGGGGGGGGLIGADNDRSDEEVEIEQFPAKRARQQQSPGGGLEGDLRTKGTL